MTVELPCIDYWAINNSFHDCSNNYVAYYQTIGQGLLYEGYAAVMFSVFHENIA